MTMAEEFGVGSRGRLYEETGVIRDVIQNHLLQVVTYLAMGAPSSTYAEAIRDEQAKVLRTIRPLTTERLVSGQYRGYRDEPDIARDSKVLTYRAIRLHVDSWRWEGVPFYARAGKRLKMRCTESRVQDAAAGRVQGVDARGGQLRAVPLEPAGCDRARGQSEASLGRDDGRIPRTEPGRRS